MRPSGLHVNKPVIIGLLASVIILFFVFRNFIRPSVTKTEVSTSEKLVDLPLLDETVLKNLQRVSKEIDIKLEENTIKIHFEQVMKDDMPKLDVLFLHGAAFSSKNWLDIKSTDHVASWGYRAVALDLPGFKKSPDQITPSLFGKFLDEFIKKLGLKKIVIIAPSLSGNYVLPYLFHDGGNISTENVVGFVPVAPVGTKNYQAKFSTSQIRTLIVYGSKDKTSMYLADLQQLPNNKVFKIEDAGHACYMDKPEDFHKALYNFLKEVSSSVK